MHRSRRCVVGAATALALAFALGAAPARAELLELSDFKAATTEGIVKLCTAPQSDPMHQAAIGYCVGYLTGAFHYYKMVEGLGAQPKLVCFGSAEPGRRELIEQYVAWAQAHPEHGKDLAIDSMFRFLGGRFPC